ncbi:MAG: hypothetical protein CEE38_16360 [Planctomycetes bacterium B3_Pla]|nr:MAG: hypothetical protein CEE38_16360 [Planctomycetes bacterium B3_Pla]
MRHQTVTPTVYDDTSGSTDGPAAALLLGRHRRAFTLVELLVVIAVIALLAALLQPVLSRAKAKAREVVCLNNLKQLQTCAKLYSLDNDDFLPPNRYVYYINTGGPSAGFDPNLTWCAGLAPFDTTTENIERGLLFRYNTSTEIYRCPSDKSRVRTPDGQYLQLRRTRSYNMSQSINGLPDSEQATLLPSFAKESEIDDPAPSKLLFFVGVHEDSILDSHFGIPPRGPMFAGVSPQWWDLPTGRHAQGGSFSFADGHVERWRWAAPKIFTERAQPVRQDGEMQDFQRVQRGVKAEDR